MQSLTFVIFSTEFFMLFTLCEAFLENSFIAFIWEKHDDDDDDCVWEGA